MKKTFISSIVVSFGAIILTGCSSTNLNLSYNEDNKKVTIDINEKKSTLSNSKKLIEKHSSSNSISNIVNANVLKYKNEKCSNITYIALPLLGPNQYYSTDIEDDINNITRDFDCKKIKSNGLYYTRCLTFGMISFQSNDGREKKHIELSPISCFDSVINYSKTFSKNNFDSEGYNLNGFNKEGIHKETKTKYNKHGYDVNGYDKKGFDKKGNDKNGYDSNGYNKKLDLFKSTGTKYDEKVLTIME